MSPYSLVAMDLDGTVVGPDSQISPRVQTAVAQAQAAGVRVTIATGRSFPSARPFIETLRITVPVICYQGAEIVVPTTGERLFRRTFSRELAAEVDVFAQSRDLELTFYADDKVFLRQRRHDQGYYDRWFTLPVYVTENPIAAMPGEPTKFLIVADEATITQLMPELQARFGQHLQIMRSHPSYVEGVSLGVSKGVAVAWLASYLGVDQAATLAIGDHHNDVSMIRWAGLGVAMGDAPPEVQTVADYVAPPVTEDGVAHVIERFILK